MEISNILVTARFERQYKKFPGKVKIAAKEKEAIFRSDPLDARLAMHKLHGREKGVWAFSITHSYRVKFTLLDPGEVLFLEIGTHDIYR